MQIIRVTGWLFSLITAIRGATIVHAQNFPTRPIRMVTTQPGSGFDLATRMNSVRELIALARAKPGQLNYGGGNTGSSAHLAAELFKSMAGVNLVHVPYKSTAQSVIALIAGEVQVMFPNATAVSPHLKPGKLRALAVTTAAPSPLLPGMPTVAASGLPGYESAAIHGIFAPARTPAPIIRRLNEEIVKVLNRPEVKEKFLSTGAMVVGSSPEQLAAAVKADMETSGKLIRALGIRGD